MKAALKMVMYSISSDNDIIKFIRTHFYDEYVQNCDP